MEHTLAVILQLPAAEDSEYDTKTTQLFTRYHMMRIAEKQQV